MAQTRREQRREETYEKIKIVARQQMAAQGTAGLSLRAIAREMGITAPAIYRYYENLDDLITTLILESFNALADALEAAQADHEGESYTDQLVAVLLAYRQWAVAHPIDFQLIYGNPIPGYVAPRDVTVPAVVRGFAIIVGLIDSLLKAGEADPQPPYNSVPPETAAYMQDIIERDGYPVTVLAFYMGIVGWTQLHGVIMLEMFNHLQPAVGDVAAYYHGQVLNLLRVMGVKPPP